MKLSIVLKASRQDKSFKWGKTESIELEHTGFIEIPKRVLSEIILVKKAIQRVYFMSSLGKSKLFLELS